LDSNQVNHLADIEAISRIPAVMNILEVICKTTEMGFAAVARVTEEKWIACAVNDQINFGLKAGEELKLETTICHEIRGTNQPVIIDHVSEDPLYCGHLTPSIYGFQSYISVPITLKNGSFFGTLCAIDPQPHVINTPATLQMFKLFADLIAFHLDTMEQMAIAETSLLEEREMADLREQFIAILGHDLRNPVGAISNAAQLLLRFPLDEKSLKLAKIIKDASFRTKGLIENILDFASGRLGGGIKLNRLENEPVEELLNGVIKELQLLWPEREIQIDFDLQTPVCCDGRRIAQLFSNLLGNALTHGKVGAVIKIQAKSNTEQFTLSISNPGEQISEAAMARLFLPFSRGEVKAGLEGLGLGLYISSEIARAHGGTLNVSSDEIETCFTLQLPNLPIVEPRS
jgi:signal transduction histidine kinase